MVDLKVDSVQKLQYCCEVVTNGFCIIDTLIKYIFCLLPLCSWLVHRLLGRLLIHFSCQHLGKDVETSPDLSPKAALFHGTFLLSCKDRLFKDCQLVHTMTVQDFYSKFCLQYWIRSFGHIKKIQKRSQPIPFLPLCHMLWKWTN